MEKVKPDENPISSKRCVPPAEPSSDAPCSPATTPRTSASRFVADRVSLIFHIKDGNCEVTLKTRKNCQYCRYKWVSIFYANTFLRIYIRSHINFVWNYFTTIRIFDGISAAKHSCAHDVLTSNLLSWLNTLRTWGQLGIRTVEYWFSLDEQDFTKRKTLES